MACQGYLQRPYSWFERRSPHHVIDMRRAGCQHHQPVEAERDPRGGRHLGERGKKVLVERVALAVDTLLLGHFRAEPAALLHRIGELAEAVGKLDPASV